MRPAARPERTGTYMKKKWLILLCAVLVMGSVVLLAQAGGGDPAQVPLTPEQVKEEGLPEHDYDPAHVQAVEEMTAKLEAEGWEIVDHSLCEHGGAITYNDVTWQRTVDGVTETGVFCPYQLTFR